MRIGCCGTIEQAEAIRSAGFEYLEVSAHDVLGIDEPDDAWLARVEQLRALPLPIEVAHDLLPARLRVVATDRDLSAISSHLERVANRAQQLGIREIVFGSGAARQRPDSVSVIEANRQLREFLRLAATVCQPHGITVLIEPMHADATNTINRLGDARQLCDTVEHPCVGVMVDTEHFGVENETDESLLDVGDGLHHVHLCEPVGGYEPGVQGPEHDNPFDFEHFFCLLRKVGYAGRMSVNSTWSGPIEDAGPRCVAFLRETWAAAAAALAREEDG